MRALALNGEANIYDINAIQEKIIKAWDGKGPLKIDVSKLVDVDASFIQLLLSCKRSAMQQSQPLELVKMTEAMRSQLDALYVSDFLFSSDAAEQSPEKEAK